MGLATFCLALGVVCGIAFVPAIASFVVYSCLLPCIQLLRTVEEGGDSYILPRFLTAVYLFCLAMAAVLSPAVYSFQTSLKDIVDVTNMPAVFYNNPSVRGEVSRRYAAAKARIDLESPL